MNDKILQALKKIRQSDEYTKHFIESLLKFEEIQNEDGFDIREEITGPFVDYIFTNKEPITRTIKNNLQITFPYKSKISRDFIMSQCVDHEHIWEPQTTKLLLLLCEKAEHVIVGGGYWGDQSILMADSMNSQGVVHCFEINNENIMFLKKNIQQNSLNNIKVIESPLWDKDDEFVELSGEDSLETCRKIKHTDTDIKPTITINTYGKLNSINKLDLIMLDIEGSELKVLQGAEQYLSQDKNKAPNLIFEIHKNYVDWSQGIEKCEIVSYILGLGYYIYAVRDYHSNVNMSNMPVELVPLDSIYLEGPSHGFNLLAIKDQSIINSLLFKITPNVSPKLLKHRSSKLHAPLHKNK